MNTVRLEPWTEADLHVLHAANTPDARRHLGGVEPAEQILSRHRRYLAFGSSGPGAMYRVLVGDEPGSVGVIGFWEKEWRGEVVYETGWTIVPGWQGKGIASAAGRLVVDAARAEGLHRYLHAYPSVDNAASNVLCGRLGFTLLGPTDFEFPPGSLMRCNDWRLDLTG
ncbi:GNAT family N-acetyltransferase [Actinomadura flavalba]|uniref:GNAT family N-acetyltransferase n=1 Tax=Actinomadura flavalba TaxID=1120938 RepID=UPI0003611938|nr:GNAT family N-acetyltransferase [Actinomadura flavalba]